MSNTIESNSDTSDSKKSPALNIADLVNVLQVFKTCAARGAFQADEMSSVGGLYDRLQDFLVSTGAVKLSDTNNGSNETTT